LNNFKERNKRKNIEKQNMKFIGKIKRNYNNNFLGILIKF